MRKQEVEVPGTCLRLRGFKNLLDTHGMGQCWALAFRIPNMEGYEPRVFLMGSCESLFG